MKKMFRKFAKFASFRKNYPIREVVLPIFKNLGVDYLKELHAGGYIRIPYKCRSFLKSQKLERAAIHLFFISKKSVYKKPSTSSSEN